MSPDVNNETLTEGLVVLTAPNKQHLLKDASEEILRREAEANTILAGLKQLNPSLAEQFYPKRTAVDDLTLRMICSPPPPPAPGVEFTVPSFLIISYCWHYPSEWTLAPAAQASQLKPDWEISQPMANAVLSQRKSADEGIWIDKICIIQSDETEKAIAVGAMDIVYRSARQLVILLEDVQLDAAEQKAAKKYAGFCKDMERLVIETGLQGAAKIEFMQSNKYIRGFDNELDEESAQTLWEDARRFISKILSARWFSRAWCAHERRIVGRPAKENTPIVFCFGADGQVIEFEFRFIHYHALRLFTDDQQSSPSFREPTFNDPGTIQHLYLRIHFLQSEVADPEISLIQYLEAFAPLECFEKGDMVSIALNTARLPLFYNGHLSTPEEVHVVLAILTIASGDIQPLIMDEGKLKYPGNNGKNTIISWVERPQILTTADSKRIPHVERHSITAATAEYIELDILLFTDLPQKPSKASMEKSLDLLNLYFLKELSDHLSTGSSAEVQKAHNYVEKSLWQQDFMQTWLALALDCGIEWIKRLPSVLIEQTTDWYWGRFTENTRFPAFRGMLEAAAIDLLSLTEIHEKDTPDFNTSYLDPTVKFFECLIDSRLKVLSKIPRRLGLGTNDWAVTNRVSNRSWIAVPTAVVHLPLLKNKAWIIEPFDPTAPTEKPEHRWPQDLTKRRDPSVAEEDIWPFLDSDFASRRDQRNDERATWRLRHKQVIFGCEPIVPDGKSVILLKKQKIYGAEDYDWAAMVRAGFGGKVPSTVQGMLDGKHHDQILDENKDL